MDRQMDGQTDFFLKCLASLLIHLLKRPVSQCLNGARYELFLLPNNGLELSSVCS